jgi:hypothetical protein
MAGFIKRHLMLLSCGVVGLLAVIALVLGVVLGDVSEALAKAERVAGELGRIRPVNEKFVAQAQARYAAITDRYNAAMRVVRELNQRKLILEGTLPAPAPDQDWLRDQFPEAYRKALQRLFAPDMLNAKPAPDRDDIDRAKDAIEADERARFSAAAPGAAGGRRGGGFQFRPDVGPTPEGVPEEQTRPGEPRGPSIEERARLRAIATRAREIYCYASADSLDKRADVLDRAPRRPEQMWAAQMSYWIQEDVIKALAGVNNAAAARLEEKDRWVANLPVKELLAIDIGGYVAGAAAEESTGGGRLGGARRTSMSGTATGWFAVTPGSVTRAKPMGNPSLVFTQRGSSDLFDVIHFAVEFVVDARALPTVLDAIAGANFYTPLMVCQAWPDARHDFSDRIYGAAPLLQVRAEFEGCFMRDIYHPMMPPRLAQELSEERPVGLDGTLGG